MFIEEPLLGMGGVDLVWEEALHCADGCERSAAGLLELLHRRLHDLRVVDCFQCSDIFLDFPAGDLASALVSYDLDGYRVDLHSGHDPGNALQQPCSQSWLNTSFS